MIEKRDAATRVKSGQPLQLSTRPIRLLMTAGAFD
jgi:hypothetical protein